mmetsp:Transcript_38978/g.97527  ORF Transcript_38978/g.97527 Transcript_38978/m.97527 type:complete len:214 (+) Transcript_38978:447-1088(+)
MRIAALIDALDNLLGLRNVFAAVQQDDVIGPHRPAIAQPAVLELARRVCLVTKLEQRVVEYDADAAQVGVMGKHQHDRVVEAVAIKAGSRRGHQQAPLLHILQRMDPPRSLHQLHVLAVLLEPPLRPSHQPRPKLSPVRSGRVDGRHEQLLALRVGLAACAVAAALVLTASKPPGIGLIGVGFAARRVGGRLGGAGPPNAVESDTRVRCGMPQ